MLLTTWLFNPEAPAQYLQAKCLLPRRVWTRSMQNYDGADEAFDGTVTVAETTIFLKVLQMRWALSPWTTGFSMMPPYRAQAFTELESLWPLLILAGGRSRPPSPAVGRSLTELGDSLQPSSNNVNIRCPSAISS